MPMPARSRMKMRTSSLFKAVMGSLLLGGFLLSYGQEFVQDLGTTNVAAEQSSQAILDGLREDDDLKDERLERELSTTIAETIKNEPDVAIRSMGPAAARPVIKGLSGSHVEVTEDGSFNGDMSATSPDHAVASEVITARKLRIVRGPNILRHSFSTAGGVVHVHRKDIPFGDTIFHGYVAGYGESGQPGYATAVGVNVPVDRVSLKGELSARKMNDMNTPDGELENTEIETSSGAVGGAVPVGNFRFGASYRWFDSDYGIPGGFIGGHPNGVDIELHKYDLTLRGLYLPASNFADTLDVTFRKNRYHHKEFETAESVGAEFLVNEDNLRMEKFISLLGLFYGIHLGGELDYRSVKMGGYVFTPPTYSYSGAVFVVASTEGWKGLEITLSSRMGAVAFRPRESVVADKDAVEDRNFALFSFDAEFSQRVGVGKFLTLDAYRTSRAPTIEELYNQGPHLAAYTYEQGNHKIDAERGYGGELEYRSYGESVNLRASMYGTWFLNYLAPRAAGDTNWSQLLPIYRVQGDEALLWGTSYSIEHDCERGIYGLLIASYVRGRYKDRRWRDLPQIPPFKAYGEIAYKFEHLRLGANVTLAAPQNKTDRYEERTPGFVTAGLSLETRWKLSLAEYSLVLRADNLFDADVRNHLSRLKSVMPEKGRNFSAFGKVQF